MSRPDVWAAEPAAHAADALSADQWAAVDAVIDRYRNRAGALIPVLEDIQETIGFIPRSIQARVAKGLGLPPAEVHGVTTFYHFFTMAPRGRHTIRCCMGTACYVRGGKNNLERLARGLEVEPGDTTPDRRFSLETVRCLGACGLAPVMVVDEDTHRQVRASRVMDIVNTYE